MEEVKKFPSIYVTEHRKNSIDFHPSSVSVEFNIISTRRGKQSHASRKQMETSRHQNTKFHTDIPVKGTSFSGVLIMPLTEEISKEESLFGFDMFVFFFHKVPNKNKNKEGGLFSGRKNGKLIISQLCVFGFTQLISNRFYFREFRHSSRSEVFCFGFSCHILEYCH